MIWAHFSLIDGHYNDYNKPKKPQVKQHIITLVNRGVATNLMNVFAKSVFVKDVCPGSDENPSCVCDSVSVSRLFIHSFIHLAYPQPHRGPRLHASGQGNTSK